MEWTADYMFVFLASFIDAMKVYVVTRPNQENTEWSSNASQKEGPS